MEYFGTKLDSHGHNLYVLTKTDFSTSRRVISELPFNPEGLPYKINEVGKYDYYRAFGFSILAICGSPADGREGSKSVFFLESDMIKEDFIKVLNEYPIARDIIKNIG